MLYRPSSFRKTAFALTAVAAFAVVSFPAAAQQAVSTRGTPSDCSPIADSGKRSICEVFQRIDAAKARATAADRRGAEANKTSTAAKDSVGCMDVVGKDIASAKARGPLTPDMKAAFKARIEKCDRVSSL